MTTPHQDRARHPNRQVSRGDDDVSYMPQAHGGTYEEQRARDPGRLQPDSGPGIDWANYVGSDFRRNEDVAAGAASYAANRGIDFNQVGIPQATRPAATMHAIYSEQKAQEEGPPQPISDKMRQSYEHLKGNVSSQWDYMTRSKEEGGMGIGIDFTDSHPTNYAGEPYGSEQEMAEDLTNRGRVKIQKNKMPEHHPMNNEDYDKFRAVHDVFGHLGSGRGFTEHGEEGASQLHLRMMDPEARPAMHNELRAINSYMVGSRNATGVGGLRRKGDRLYDLSDLAVSDNPEAVNRPRRLSSKGEQLGARYSPQRLF